MRRPALVAFLWLLALPLAAQQRELIFTLYGGGADHLADLAKSPPAWFMPGYAVGASVGWQLNSSFAVHGDFMYTRNPVERRSALGAVNTTFSGADVNRFYYGAHAEFRRDIGTGVVPYLFAGGGAVTIDQLGIDQFRPATRPAVMFGGGLFYNIKPTAFDFVGEIKGLTYRWNMAGFNRIMLDVTYTAGVSYRLGF
jgi:hypothetical protein